MLSYLQDFEYIKILSYKYAQRTQMQILTTVGIAFFFDLDW